MKSPNETNVRLNEADPVSAILQIGLPLDMDYICNLVPGSHVRARRAFIKAQRTAILRFCEAVEKHAETGCLNDTDVANAYFHVKDLVFAAAQQEKK